MRQCSGPCKETKPLKDFYLTTRGKPMKWCKKCHITRTTAQKKPGNNLTTEEKYNECHKEMVIRGKEIEKINRIRKLPRDGKNILIVLKKIDKVMDKYEKRCNCFSPSEIAKMEKTGSEKNY